MAWAESVGAHWEKIEAEYNAEWAKLAYLDGPGYTAWDRIEAKYDLRRKYFSRSSSHGVQNSIEKTPTQPCSPPFTSCIAESKGQHNSRTVDYAREIRESCARILELLQEEIGATESTKDELPTLEETLPSMEPLDEQVVDDSVGERTTMVSSETPIIGMPLLNQDANSVYPITAAFPKDIARFDEPPIALPVVNWRSCKGSVIDLSSMLITSLSLSSDMLVLKPVHPCVFNPTPTSPPPPKPPDRSFQKFLVKSHVIWNLIMPTPPLKPPDAIYGAVDIVVLPSCVEIMCFPKSNWKIVCANGMVINTELSTDSDHHMFKDDLVDEKRYDNLVLELAYSRILTYMFNDFVVVRDHVKVHVLLPYLFRGIAHDSHCWVCHIKCYAQFGYLNSAHQVFVEMLHQGVFSSTTLIQGFLATGNGWDKEQVHTDPSCYQISLGWYLTPIEEDLLIKFRCDSFLTIPRGSNEVGIQEGNAKLVSRVSNFESYSYKEFLGGTSDMVPWIQVLLCESVHSKVVPARCWMKLSGNADCAWAVLSPGSVSTLLSNFHIVNMLQSVSQSFNPGADYFSVVDLSSTKYTIYMVKMDAPSSFFFSLLHTMLMIDCRSKKSSVGSVQFYVHGNMYGNADPISLLVYVGSYIQYLLAVFEEFDWVSYSDQVHISWMCLEVNMNSALYLIVAWFYENFGSVSLSIFEYILQLYNMALEPYQVHLLSYMKDPSNEYALKLVGLISFSTTVVVVDVTEGHSLVMPLSLAFSTKCMMHDISLFHHLAACEMDPATTIFSDMTVTLTTTHMITATACKGGKIKDNIFHYEGTNSSLKALFDEPLDYVKKDILVSESLAQHHIPVFGSSVHQENRATHLLHMHQESFVTVDWYIAWVCKFVWSLSSAQRHDSTPLKHFQFKVWDPGIFFFFLIICQGKLDFRYGFGRYS